MLTITIPEKEFYDEIKNEFIKTKSHTLRLEHSLVSLSKWESKWHKPFLSIEDKSIEESIDYIRCMTITQNVPIEVYNLLTDKNMLDVSKYIDETMTATTFVDQESKRSNDVITAEIIYYWILTYTIPIECQKWHLNRLLTLVKVCSLKNSPPKKMSRQDIINRNRDLNAIRRRKLNSKG